MNVFPEFLLKRIVLFSIGLIFLVPSTALAQSESRVESSAPSQNHETVSGSAGLLYFGSQESSSSSLSPNRAIFPQGEDAFAFSVGNGSVVSNGDPAVGSFSVSSSPLFTESRLDQAQHAKDLWSSSFNTVSQPVWARSSDASNVARLDLSQLPFSETRTDSIPKLWRYGKLFAASSSETEAEPEPPYGEIPLILNPSVERKIRYFQTVIPDRFQEWLDRFQKYKPVVEQIFAEFELPQELVYLSVIESGFNPRAYSRARAAGPWQFMKSTGRIYGLRVNWYIDERRDPIKSTVAAAQHLRDLYDRFGSWPLAMAAYNAGAGKITRAIRKSGTRDYWKIRRTRFIRRETREYVPKFMAATIIATNPTLFGFRVGTDEVLQYDEVLMKNTIHLRTVAKKTGLAFEDLRQLNPELRRSITPPEKDGYFLKVPVGMGYHVENVREELKQWTQPPPHITWYRVRRGDSLSVIAHRFNMSMGKLKGLNNLSRNLIRVGQRLRVNEGVVLAEENTKWYRVRRGDSLWTIAKRFSVSVRDLKILNKLRSSVIHAGRMLMVSP
jgi:membrane-bound lytic murein transglycosylase D